MTALSIIALCSAVITIVCRYKESPLLWLFKPFTMVAIVLIAAFFGEASGTYKFLIVAALLFSLVGDVILIEEERLFVYGLGFFLVAHLIFISAFWIVADGEFYPVSLLVYLLGLGGYFVIRTGLPKHFTIPVIFYNLAISTMLCTALNFWIAERSENAIYALAGSVFFVVSDSILAVNKFHTRFKTAHIYILATYFLAQWLIAISI